VDTTRDTVGKRKDGVGVQFTIVVGKGKDIASSKVLRPTVFLNRHDTRIRKGLVATSCLRFVLITRDRTHTSNVLRRD